MTGFRWRLMRLIAGVLILMAAPLVLDQRAAGATVPVPPLRPILEEALGKSAVVAPAPSQPPAAGAGTQPDAYIPSPVLRPDLALSTVVENADFLVLRTAIAAMRKGDYVAARAERAGLRAPLARSLFDWLYVRDSQLDAGFADIIAFLQAHPDWPQQDLLRARMEAALFAHRPGSAAVIETFRGTAPRTGLGKAALAIAYLERGERKSAAAWAQDAWENHTLSSFEETLISSFLSDLMTRKSHKTRLDRLLYADETEAAQRMAKRLGREAIALAAARKAVSERSRRAGKLLDALAAEQAGDPVALLSRVQWLRRADKDVEASRLILTAPRNPALLLDEWQWWEERRILARRMLDRGNAETAYLIASGHTASEGLAFAEAEFMAGWVALRYLGRPEVALKHFEAFREKVSTELSLSRAYYWLGRSFEALGQLGEARARYQSAASYYTTYYGQLARLKLSQPSTLDVSPVPQATAEERRLFLDRELVRAARLLGELGEMGLAAVFLIELASSLDSTAEIALAGALALDFGMPHVAIRIGKIAASRDRPVPDLAFLTGAIPGFSAHNSRIEPALVHAIARQESSFNAGAVSSAGARGLMQLMPATAKESAHRAGLGYAPRRLTDDPAYNVTLGAAYLGELLRRFNGSYIMTVAAYNAGPSRVNEWVANFGDPREAQVDPIDWIERIPFSETRNYVQRVLENLQVYRARLNGDRHELKLVADLTRGG